MRVLYSFPNRIGAGRICWTAWQQATGLAAAGADVTVWTSSVFRAPEGVREIHSSLAAGPVRFPMRLLGSRRAAIVHDWAVSRWLRRNGDRVDVVHVWPLGGLRTMRVAKELGIPTFHERPNTHTAYAYQSVDDECRAIGLELPDGFEHKYDERVLSGELLEYDACDHLLCPSDFVRRTFVERGIPESKLLRHRYGFDARGIRPGSQDPTEDRGLVTLYAGLCTPRKGLHAALKAWRASKAGENGRFLICGGFVPGYRELLADLLDHPGIEVLGHRGDLPELMAEADLFILPSVEEGSALVTYEARGAGCVLMVSDASGAVCEHMRNGLIHPMRDVETLRGQLDMVATDRSLLSRLREESLAGVADLTWESAGKHLLDVYRSVVRPSGPEAVRMAAS